MSKVDSSELVRNVSLAITALFMTVVVILTVFLGPILSNEVARRSRQLKQWLLGTALILSFWLLGFVIYTLLLGIGIENKDFIGAMFRLAFAVLILGLVIELFLAIRLVLRIRHTPQIYVFVSALTVVLAVLSLAIWIIDCLRAPSSESVPRMFSLILLGFLGLSVASLVFRSCASLVILSLEKPNPAEGRAHLPVWFFPATFLIAVGLLAFYLLKPTDVLQIILMACLVLTIALIMLLVFREETIHSIRNLWLMISLFWPLCCWTHGFLVLQCKRHGYLDCVGYDFDKIPRFPGSRRAAFRHATDSQVRNVTIVYETLMPVQRVAKFYSMTVCRDLDWVITRSCDNLFRIIVPAETAASVDHTKPDVEIAVGTRNQFIKADPGIDCDITQIRITSNAPQWMALKPYEHLEWDCRKKMYPNPKALFFIRAKPDIQVGYFPIASTVGRYPVVGLGYDRLSGHTWQVEYLTAQPLEVLVSELVGAGFTPVSSCIEKARNSRSERLSIEERDYRLNRVVLRKDLSEIVIRQSKSLYGGAPSVLLRTVRVARD